MAMVMVVEMVRGDLGDGGGRSGDGGCGGGDGGRDRVAVGWSSWWSVR